MDPIINWSVYDSHVVDVEDDFTRHSPAVSLFPYWQRSIDRMWPLVRILSTHEKLVSILQYNLMVVVRESSNIKIIMSQSSKLVMLERPKEWNARCIGVVYDYSKVKLESPNNFQ